MDEKLYLAARDGALVLTVNDRLARNLSQQYDQVQQKKGIATWLRPEILSLTGWLNRCQSQVKGLPLFLNKVQLQHVWEKIVTDDVERTGNYLLQIPQTARRALQAHQLLVRYSAAFTHDEAAEDHRAFLRWRKEWQVQSVAQGWCDSVDLPWLLATAVNDKRFVVPTRIVLAGFDEITPDLSHLCQVLEQGGARIDQWSPQPCLNISQQRVTADDPADEVSRCARWVKGLLTNNPTAKIAVVAPQLEIYQPLIEQMFTAELDPGALLSADETPHAFNLSLGRSLEKEGVAHAALRLLRIGLQLDHDEISWLLRSPYVRGGVSESHNRAKIDRELRRLRRFDWPLPRLAKTLKGLSEKYSIAVPEFISMVESVGLELRHKSNRMPGSWAESFANFLHQLGWPGARGLSSREYQAMQHLRDALGELASLDSVAKPIDRSEAVKLFSRMASSVEFQPEGGADTVQVLGELESSGLTFDHLWIMGLHASALPRSPSPNPFIPLPVQRRHRMKRADAERESLFAEQVVSRLFSAAPDIVLSWPQREKGAEQRPSPFLNGISEGQPVLADSCAPDTTLWLNRPPLEQLSDRQAPPISSRKPFSGGTGIIKDQALCPFRAFAHHRLRAERLDEPDIGIDNMSRGSLVHTVLELFWDKTVDQATLLSLEEQAFSDALYEAVDGALGRLERERRYDLPPRQKKIERHRLFQLARLWLNVEARRGPFRVVSSEESHQVKIGNLLIRTRIDRIDELEDGTRAIIDYKTGQPDPLQWLDDRVTEPQLPAYCLGLSREQIGAVMFAMVRGKEKECGFRGLARDIDNWPGAKSRKIVARLEEKNWESFDEVLKHWQKILPDLGDAFARGDASVDPVDPELACKYCDLKSLCRVLELQTVALEAGEND
jgi:ATP-dependent helicase/nuclease subunit B